MEPATPMARPLSGPRRHRAPAMMSLAPSASLEAGGNLLRTLLKQHMVSPCQPYHTRLPSVSLHSDVDVMLCITDSEHVLRRGAVCRNTDASCALSGMDLSG